MTGTRKEHGPRGIDQKHLGSVPMVTEPEQGVWKVEVGGKLIAKRQR